MHKSVLMLYLKLLSYDPRPKTNVKKTEDISEILSHNREVSYVRIAPSAHGPLNPVIGCGIGMISAASQLPKLFLQRCSH